MPDPPGPEGETVSSTAVVPTDAAARYAKQLLAHLGRQAGSSRSTASPTRAG